MAPGKQLFILFDGNALVHRAFHALPPLTITRTGEMINAVQGFASTLLKLLRENKPDYWAIAFDRHAPTFRHDMFDQYKANRPPTPKELITQIERVHQMSEAFKLPIFEMDGYEADDIIGTLSRQAAGHGIDTLIVTGDNDMLQVVQPGISVMSPRRGFADTVIYDENAVREKYGLQPMQLISYKALVGDASDNIPGVKGIGDKTAVKLLQQYHDLDDIYDHIQEIQPEKLRSLLTGSRDLALKNRELAAIVTVVPVTFDPAACAVGSYDRNNVVELFRELGFSALLSRLPDEIGSAAPAAIKAQEYVKAGRRIISNLEELSELVLKLQKAGSASMIVIASGEKAMQDDLVGMAFAADGQDTCYLPIGHRVLSATSQLPRERIFESLKPFLSGKTDKIAYDGKFNIVLLAQQGLDTGKISFDILIAGYLLGEKSLKLKPMSFTRLGTETPALSDITGTGAKQVSPANLPIEQVGEIACADADIVLRLRTALEKEMRDEELWPLLNDVEMPLIPILAEMEMHGVLLDTALLNDMSSSLGADMLRLEMDAYNSVGHQFNINSSQQLAQVLFNELRLTAGRKTTRGYSTDASTLEELRGQHPVIDTILQYRGLAKLKSTYTDALPQLVNSRTGRVHTTFNQAGTTTGRLSSSDPNLQNLPVRGEIGARIRQAIMAPPGWLLLSADYSQIDLRALAHLSSDRELINTFMRDEDIHTHTASEIFGVSDEQVTSEMRRVAKTVNFGVIYGMSGYGLEQATSLTREQAESFITAYFKRYPGVKDYIINTKRQAAEQGYVQTVLGRRRYIPEVKSPNRVAREAAERMAINMPVQGTSADIIKIAMINLHREMAKRILKAKMILQVHDELVFEVPEAEVGIMRQLVHEIMPAAMQLAVPLKIDIKAGKNWGEMN